MYRNDRVWRSLAALALLAFVALFAGSDAHAARTQHYVDGGGMSDGSDDPRGGGGSMEGDPWGGEQIVVDPVEDGPRTPVIESTSTSTTSSPAQTQWNFWDWLASFWTFLLR